MIEAENRRLAPAIVQPHCGWGFLHDVLLLAPERWSIISRKGNNMFYMPKVQNYCYYLHKTHLLWGKKRKKKKTVVKLPVDFWMEGFAFIPSPEIKSSSHFSLHKFYIFFFPTLLHSSHQITVFLFPLQTTISNVYLFLWLQRKKKFYPFSNSCFN